MQQQQKDHAPAVSVAQLTNTLDYTFIDLPELVDGESSATILVTQQHLIE